MFKIIALVVALSGQPIDVLVSNKSYEACPSRDSLVATSLELQVALDAKQPNKYFVKEAQCVASDRAHDEAMKLLRQQDS